MVSTSTWPGEWEANSSGWHMGCTSNAFIAGAPTASWVESEPASPSAACEEQLPEGGLNAASLEMVGVPSSLEVSDSGAPGEVAGHVGGDDGGCKASQGESPTNDAGDSEALGCIDDVTPPIDIA
eukprot:scaffold220283_cov28-Tisochrysis_lutea.AAC.1